MNSQLYYKDLTKRIYGTLDGYRDVCNLMYYIEVMYESFRKIKPVLKENESRDFKETFYRLKNHYKDLKYLKNYIKSKRRINIGELTSDAESESNFQLDETSCNSTTYSECTKTEIGDLKAAINSMDKFLNRKQNYLIYTSQETKKDFNILYKLIKKERNFCYNYSKKIFTQ